MNERFGANNQEKKEEKNLDILFFDPPMYTDQDIAYQCLDDSQRQQEIPKGMHAIASELKSKNINSLVVPLDPFIKKEIIGDKKIDENEFGKKVLEIVEKQIEENNPTAVGISLRYSFAEPMVIKIAQYCKEKFPDKTIIVGGGHASHSAYHLLNPENKTGIDVIVRGEGEVTVKELVEELKKQNHDFSSVKGISYLDNNNDLRNNPPRERYDLKQLPILDYSLIKFPHEIDISNFNHYVSLVRGCKGNCSFCTSPNRWGKEISIGEMSNFVKEMRYLLENGVDQIGIMDDDILADQEAFEKMMASLKKIHDDFPESSFFAQSTVSHLKDFKHKAGRVESNLRLMKEAGINLLYLGAESGSQNVLNAMRKKHKAEWIKEACENAKKQDIKVGTFWIFGHPGATEDEDKKTLALIEELFAKKLIDEVESHIAVPLPGAAMANDPRVKVFDTNKKHYGIYNNYPVHDLVDEKGETVYSHEKINENYKKSLELAGKINKGNK